MYMMSPKTKTKGLRWRVNCIRYWRKFYKLTQQQVADALERDPLLHKDDRVETHASIGRIEKGLQCPSIGLIEALARLYKTDVDSMLNRRPDAAAAEIPHSAKGMMQLWDRAKPQDRDLIIDVAKKVVQADP